MNRALIWMIKSAMITPSRKNLTALVQREDLFDFSGIDEGSEEYKTAMRNFKKAEKMGCSIVTFADENYPECLRSLSLPPAVLYVRGNVAALNDVIYIGIVGSRKCDDYGMRVAADIASEVGYTGVGIVSGGATGIDAAAHRGALRAKVPTLAVLGCGLDVSYPVSNRKLFEQIEKTGGAVISEFSFGTPPYGRNFPHRNRIIAAMAEAVAVVRGGEHSGSLITANQALSMNKSVYAVPGNIDNALSAAPNGLISDGATPLLSPFQIIDELISRYPDYFVRQREMLHCDAAVKKAPPKTEESKEKVQKEHLSEYEKEVVCLIEDGVNTQAALEGKVSFNASRLTALLGMMEIKGIIKRKIDKSYIIIGGKC